MVKKNKHTFMIRRILPVFLFFAFFSGLPCPAGAQSAEEAFADFYRTLPSEIRDRFPLANESLPAEEAVETALTPHKVAEDIGLMFGDAARKTVGSLASILSILLLSVLIKSHAEGTGEGIEKALTFLISLAVLGTLFLLIVPLWQETTGIILFYGNIIRAEMPVITAIYTLSGQVASGGMGTLWLSALLSLLDTLTEKLLTPLLGVSFGFLVMMLPLSESGAPYGTGLNRLLKQTLTVFLTVTGFLITVLFGFQTALTRVSDSILLRSVKFASGSFVPVLGGALGEAASAYLSGLSLIKNTVGILSLTALLYTALPTLIHLFFVRFGLSVLGMAAGALGFSGEEKMIGEAAEILGMALSLIITVGMVFILMTALIMKVSHIG